MNEEKKSIRYIIKKNLYDYEYMLNDYDYYVFVETILDSIQNEINKNNKTDENN